MSLLSIFRFFYLLGAVNAIFFSVLIFSRKSKINSDKILAIWLIILSFQLIFPFIYLANLKFYYRYAGLEVCLSVLHPFFLFQYIKSVSAMNTRNIRTKAISFLLVLAELMALSWFLLPASSRLEMILGNQSISNSFVFVTIIAFIVYFLYFFTISYKALLEYKAKIVNIFSYQKSIDLLWLRRLVLFFYCSLSLSFFIGCFFMFYHHSIIIGDYFFYVTLTVFIYFLAYWGYRQGQIFNFNTISHENEKKNNSKRNRISVINQDQISEKALLIRQVVENKELYLYPSLTIHDLSLHLDIQPHFLSKIINREFNCNFFEFINEYRIKAFKEKVNSADYKNFTILAIAFDCGFNSKSAFNRIFKEYTGMTPGDYIKKTL